MELDLLIENTFCDFSLPQNLFEGPGTFSMPRESTKFDIFILSIATSPFFFLQLHTFTLYYLPSSLLI